MHRARLLPFLALLFLAPPAPAQNVAPATRRDGYVFDVTKGWGAVPGSQTQTLDVARDNIMAYIKAGRPSSSPPQAPPPAGRKKYVYIPDTVSGIYYKDPTLWDADDVEVIGDLGGSLLKPVSGRTTAGITFGVSETPGGVALADDHFVELNGRLTFAVSPGTYFGYSTRSTTTPLNHAHVSFPPGTPFAQGAGDYWSNAGWQLTTGGTITGGTYTLTMTPGTTAAIAWTADTSVMATRIDTALEALPGMGQGTFVVTPMTTPPGITTFAVQPNGAALSAGGPLSLGANSLTGTAPTVAVTRALTVEFALDQGGSVLPEGGSGTAPNQLGDILFGISDPKSGGSPRGIGRVKVVTGGNLQYAFATADQPYGSYRFVNIPMGGSTGIVHYAFQLDLANCTFTAYKQDGLNPATATQVATGSVTTSGSGAAWAPASNLKLRPNYEYAFNVGATSASSHSVFGETPNTEKILYPIKLLGLKVSAGLRYAANGATTPQVRVETGTATTDAIRYLYTGTTEIAYLPLTDKPVSLGGRQGARVIHCMAGKGIPNGNEGVCNGWFLNTDTQGGLQGWGRNNTLRNAARNLNVIQPYHWGTPISLGAAENVTVKDCRVTGGFHGVGSNPNMGTVWGTSISDCTFDDQMDASIYLYYTIGTVRDIRVERPGTTVFRLAGDRVDISDVYIHIHPAGGISYRNGYPYETIVDIHNAQGFGAYALAHFSQDGENGAWPSIAVVRAELHNNTGTWTNLKVDDFWMGKIGPSAYYIKLHDVGAVGSGGYKRGHLAVRDFHSFSPSGAGFLATDGPGWSGTIEGLQHPWETNAATPVPLPFLVATGTIAPYNNVVFMHREYDARPTVGAFVAGAHRLFYRNPAPGSPAEEVVTGSGVMGTGSPATFSTVSTVAP